MLSKLQATLIRILFIAFLSLVWTSVHALPPESRPLKPRVPIQHRTHYRNLQAPMFENSRHVEKSLLEQGQKIYQRICVNCHGETGKGDGVSAGFLPVLPRDFTNCRFQRKRTDGELFYVIKFGSWPMPPMVPSISENEAWIVIPYIRTFCKN